MTKAAASSRSRWNKLRQGLLAGTVTVFVLLLLWGSNAFAQMRLRLSNGYFVPAPVSDKVVIVAIDDASLAEYGRSLSDWSRTVYADLVTEVSAAGARAVVFDLVFDLPDDGDDALADAIQAARQSEARTRTIMPVIGVQLQSSVSNAAQAVPFDNRLRPNQILVDSIDATGYVNAFPDVDGTIRRQPSIIQVGDDPGLSLSLAAYLAYLRIPAAAWQQVIEPGDRILKLTADRILPVDEFGFWVQNYFGPPSTPLQPTFTSVSLLDVVQGNVEHAVFADRVILVGLMNSTSFIDQYPVPSGADGHMMAGVEIQANAIETLIQNRFVYEQSRISEFVMIFALTLGASLLYAQLRWYWMLPAALVLWLGWLAFCFVRFSFQMETINLFHSSLALVLPVIANGALNISAEIRRRQKTEFLLDSLAEVSSQHLALDKILPGIASEVQRLTQTSSGAIRLWNSDTEKLEPAHEWLNPPANVGDLDPVWATVLARRQMIKTVEHLAVPVVWQQQVIAAIVVCPDSQQHITKAQTAVLQEFVQQIAPALENAILHNRVERQKTLVETLLSGSPAGIMVLDQHLNLLRTNRALDNIWQLNLALLTGQPFASLLSLIDVARSIQDRLVEQFDSGGAFRQELPVGTKTFEIRAAPLEAYQQWVVILTDVSSFADLNKLKTHMIRMASHDLKNPLARVMLYANLTLKTQELSPKSRDALEHINKGAVEMKRIINDILDLEQLRAEVTQRVPVDLPDLIDEVIEQHHISIETKRQTLTTDIAPKLPTVLGNRRHLIQMVTNLLGNAVKYTPDDGRLSLKLFLTEKQYLRLEIGDTGYGISRQDQKKLFTEFFRVRTDATAHITGTGLGLSLAKTVVESHGGRIWVESEENKGSTFFVELPTLQDLLYEDP